MPTAILTPHEELVEAIKSRQSQNEFNYGILTADRYVKSISDCIGSDGGASRLALRPPRGGP